MEQFLVCLHRPKVAILCQGLTLSAIHQLVNYTLFDSAEHDSGVQDWSEWESEEAAVHALHEL